LGRQDFAGGTVALKGQCAEAAKLDKAIWANLEDIGYGQ